ncbi:Fic/DOC family protein [Salegentibacter echinorum]|uniref:Fic/DOC family protein n=1 Tax=Salegentibacter echinorum TaxID=1073325 RepID=A0A1M5BUB7_SALEC|nr:Fic family protein [Salegentibacter echinorum]SHF46035.1 Fic/DOC family protein [Salegentibacter echinorum]
MSNRAHFYSEAPVFHGLERPENGIIVGYAAIIDKLVLNVPIHKPVALICDKNKSFVNEDWQVFQPSYLPEDHGNLSKIEALYKHLVFSLKYEGVNLAVFSALTRYFSEEDLYELIDIEPTGRYSRRIWFLLEWIMEKKIPGKEALTKKSYVHAIDENLQFAVNGIKSKRHLVINNLPGTPYFCPLIRRTAKLEFSQADIEEKKTEYLKGLRKDIIQRASAFLLLKDSKASFSIEGESPRSKRAARWGKAIGQAGTKDLSEDELVRLQQVVIENSRFVEMGFRKKGGFIGEHDRTTGEPIPDHISAKPEDLTKLIKGLLATNQLLLKNDFAAVMAAAKISFGFVFIHPFVDGNGRIHRYIIHHLLAKKKFSQQGVIFPVSASILDHIEDYRNVLEDYSHPLLDHIEWEQTSDNNVQVMNETLDFYRFFDITKQTEFLYDCVNDTIDNIIPQEIQYLTAYDTFKRWLDDEYEMPDKIVALLVRFLEQNDGKLSKRAQEKEFSILKPREVLEIEEKFTKVFNAD